MAEVIKYFDLHGNVIWEGDRTIVLKDQERISRSTLTWSKVADILSQGVEIPPENFAVESIMMFLFDKNQNVYIVQRSENKAENPGLWDKSAWWHVVKWDTFDSTATKELDEELGVSSIVAKDLNDLLRILRNENLDNTAVLLGVSDIKNYISKRTTPAKDSWYKLFNSRLYVGFYNGDVTFKDGEAVGRKLIPLENLEAEIKNNPELYTSDVLMLVQQFKILEFAKGISSRIQDIVK